MTKEQNELENSPDLIARVPVQIWVIIADEEPPADAIVTPTHHPDIHLAWMPAELNVRRDLQ